MGRMDTTIEIHGYVAALFDVGDGHGGVDKRPFEGERTAVRKATVSFVQSGVASVVTATTLPSRTIR